MGVKGRTPDLDASGLRLAIVVSRYNEDICAGLLQGAERSLRAHGGAEPDVHWVPGAFEIPVVARQLAGSGQYDAVVCLGCVVKGDTAHFEYVAGEAARGIMQVQVDTGVPCAFGVLTTYDREQAVARAGERDNKGAEAVAAAIEVANLMRSIRGTERSA